jgi:signal transduction histidine kinase
MNLAKKSRAEFHAPLVLKPLTEPLMTGMLDELEAMMREYEVLTCGLDDRSEELEDRSESDAQIRFYRAMATIDINYALLLDRLATTSAELLADTCLVHLTGPDGKSIELAAAHHPNPVALQSIRQAYASSTQSVGVGVIGKVAATGQPYFRPRWSVEAMRADIGQDYFNLVSSLGLHSVIVVPMVGTDGRRLGTLTVARHATKTPYDSRDLALTQWVASHAAMKIENARLYQDLSETNKRLDAALKSKYAFLGMVAHELRTPMTSLSLVAQLLIYGDELGVSEGPPPDWKKRVESVSVHVARMARITSQLVEVTRVQDGEVRLHPKPFDLAELVRDIVERFELELERAQSPLLLTVKGNTRGIWDAERLDHVVTNLVSNALKYGPGRPIRVTIEGGDETITLTIRDHGKGICPEDRARIFERFERGSRTHDVSGLGLGLWIVRSMVHAHSGEVSVESPPGRGACFRVVLPKHVPSSPLALAAEAILADSGAL